MRVCHCCGEEDDGEDVHDDGKVYQYGCLRGCSDGTGSELWFAGLRKTMRPGWQTQEMGHSLIWTVPLILIALMVHPPECGNSPC